MKKNTKNEIIPVFYEPKAGTKVVVGSADIRDGEVTLNLFDQKQLEEYRDNK